MLPLKRLRSICAIAIVSGVLFASAVELSHAHHEEHGEEAAAECTTCIAVKTAAKALRVEPFVLVGSTLSEDAHVDEECARAHVERPVCSTRGPPLPL